MSTTHTSDCDEPRHPAVDVAGALARARKARHHPDCNCRNYERRYCNPMDALWSRAMDRELDALTREKP